MELLASGLQVLSLVFLGGKQVLRGLIVFYGNCRTTTSVFYLIITENHFKFNKQKIQQWYQYFQSVRLQAQRYCSGASKQMDTN